MTAAILCLLGICVVGFVAVILRLNRIEQILRRMRGEPNT
jgi:hypothetical protein